MKLDEGLPQAIYLKSHHARQGWAFRDAEDVSMIVCLHRRPLNKHPTFRHGGLSPPRPLRVED
jgi:hypothetical protein